MRMFLIANHDNHHYISDVGARLWMISCMGFRGKEIKIVLDRSFPTLGMGWMSQTRVGWGEVPGISRKERKRRPTGAVGFHAQSHFSRKKREEEKLIRASSWMRACGVFLLKCNFPV